MHMGLRVSGLAASLLVLAGCVGAEPTPIGAGGSGTSSPGTCVLDFPQSTSACETCLTTNCCSEDNACGSSSDCLALISCGANCPSGSSTCLNSCESAHPTGNTLFNSYFTCLTSNCAGCN